MKELNLTTTQHKVLYKMLNNKCVGYKDQEGLPQFSRHRWWYILSFSGDTVDICSLTHTIIHGVSIEDLLL